MGQEKGASRKASSQAQLFAPMANQYFAPIFLAIFSSWITWAGRCANLLPRAGRGLALPASPAVPAVPDQRHTLLNRDRRLKGLDGHFAHWR